MNRKIIATALAALTAASALGTASVASAQNRGPQRAEPPRVQAPARPTPARPTPPRTSAPVVQAPRAQAPAPARVQAPQAYGRWQQSQRRYSAGRYTPPRGYQARNWSYGQRLPSQYRTRTYVVNNYAHYGLRAPPRGYEYVRTGNDVVLAAVATGLITAVIAGLFN